MIAPAKHAGVSVGASSRFLATGRLTVSSNFVAQIKHHHGEIATAMSSVLWHAIEAGGLLAAAKAQVPYGEFGDWVERECGINYRTARRYMLAHKRLAQLPESEWPSMANLEKAISVSSPKGAKPVAATNRPEWLPAVGRAVEFDDGHGRVWYAWAYLGSDHYGVAAEFMVAMVINLSGDGGEPVDFMPRGVRCNHMVAAIGDILTISLISFGLKEPASAKWKEIEAELPISRHAELSRLARSRCEDAADPERHHES